MNWELKPSLGESWIKTSFFLSDSVGYFATGDGQSGLFKTTDGGEIITKDSLIGGRDMEFISEQVGFIVTGGVKITSDSGVNWAPYFMENNISISSITRINNSTLLLTGDTFFSAPFVNKGFITSIDFSGNVLSRHVFPSINRIVSSFSPAKNIAFFGAQLYAAQPYGTIYRTDNNGITWIQENLPDNVFTVFDINCANENFCFALSSNQLLKRYFSTGLKEVQPKLIEIYPNPSRGIINITSLSKERKNISIYNVLGEKIQSFNISAYNTIVVQINTPGIYIAQSEGFFIQKFIVTK